MKIRFNKEVQAWEVYSKTMFGENNVHAHFDKKSDAKEYVENNS